MSQFRVRPDDFMKNPLTADEFATIESVEALRTAAKMRGIIPAARPFVWPVLFNILPLDARARTEALRCRTSEYLAVREQWRSMPKTQFKYNTIVCDAFSTIRVDVKRTHPPQCITKVAQWDQILFNILRTFTLWNLDVCYTQGLNDLAVVFMTVFIPARNEVLDADVDAAEALAFWCFAAFVELIGSGLIADNLMVMQDRELKQIMAIITRFHPACATWLSSNGLEDLSFLISSFILAFGR
jgi:hypothetical protein